MKRISLGSQSIVKNAVQLELNQVPDKMDYFDLKILAEESKMNPFSSTVTNTLYFFTINEEKYPGWNPHDDRRTTHFITTQRLFELWSKMFENYLQSHFSQL